MGHLMDRRFNDPRIIDNDALVVLCLRSLSDAMTHHDLKIRASALGFDLSTSTCHNMLSRAGGRVMLYPDKKWRITVAGWTYREHVLVTLSRLLMRTEGGLKKVLDAPVTDV